MYPYVQLCLVLGTESAILRACVGLEKCPYRAETVAYWWFRESRKIEATASIPVVCLISRAALLLTL